MPIVGAATVQTSIENLPVVFDLEFAAQLVRQAVGNACTTPHRDPITITSRSIVANHDDLVFEIGGRVDKLNPTVQPRVELEPNQREEQMNWHVPGTDGLDQAHCKPHVAEQSRIKLVTCDYAWGEKNMIFDLKSLSC